RPGRTARRGNAAAGARAADRRPRLAGVAAADFGVPLTMRVITVRAAFLLFLVLLLGCAPAQPAGVPVAQPRPTVQPTPVATYAPVSVPAAQPAAPDVIASAPPLSPLPQPGNMPGGSGMREIQDRGKLVAGVYQDVLQFGYLDPVKNDFQGFDI